MIGFISAEDKAHRLRASGANQPGHAQNFATTQGKAVDIDATPPSEVFCSKIDISDFAFMVGEFFP